MIEATLIGTGGMLPLPDRWLTALWLEYNGKACLIDCGEGTQIAIKKHGIKLSHLDTLLITHLHADHISGLAGLLLSLGNCGKTDVLKIYGHIGIAETVRKLCCICPVLPFEIEIHELPLDRKADFEWNEMVISSMPMKHSVDCLGYSLVLNRKPVFSPQKAKSLNIDVRYWKELHAGNTLVIDGREITQEMVTDGQRKPIKVTYMTDSRYFSDMIDFAKDSDLLISEGMYGDDEYTEKMAEKGHMVFSQSARIARDSHSHTLWLTHYSPALVNPAEYTDSVRAIFADTIISRDGEKTVLK
ncbi:MAG: ribonuclease Z [Ruminococcus flavefaciens]|nr:ribonuclease Z [Ruminococcus flavefaciens]MCM1229404.1 ribonuclease Z [Ruminococcus flavefaciens]